MKQMDKPRVDLPMGHVNATTNTITDIGEELYEACVSGDKKSMNIAADKILAMHPVIQAITRRYAASRLAEKYMLDGLESLNLMRAASLS